MTTPFSSLAFPSLAALMLLAAPVLAVKTQHFTDTSADDFKKGQATNVVVTSTGQLRLGRQIEPLLPKDVHYDAIQAVAEAPDGSVVFSAFPDGAVLSLKDGKLTTLATFKDQTVTALAYDAKGRLLIGVGGEQAKLARLDKAGEEPSIVCEPKDAHFIWSILPTANGTFLATGPGGEIFKVNDKGAAEVFAETSGDNVTCLTTDKTNLYAGTDGDALVYKIDLGSARPFVLFEAQESEISALAWDNHGNLLAATSDPSSQSNPAPEKPNQDKTTKNELPSAKPTPPKPPEEKPGDAIPKGEASPVNVPTSGPAKKPQPNVMPNPADENPKPETPAAAGNAIYRIDRKASSPNCSARTRSSTAWRCTATR